MIYSELSKLNNEHGLTFNPETLTLEGVFNGYSVAIADDKSVGEFIIAVFAKADCGLPKLAEMLPKNSINSLNFGKSAVTVRISAYPLSQENLPLLIKAAGYITETLTVKPLPPDMSAVVNSKASDFQPGEPRFQMGRKAKVRGAFGAATGAVAGYILAYMLFQINPALFSWLNGGLIAVIIISNYLFLAKEIGKSGIILCCVLTLAAVMLGAIFGDVYYLIKSLIVSPLVSAAFYLLYFRPRKPPD